MEVEVTYYHYGEWLSHNSSAPFKVGPVYIRSMDGPGDTAKFGGNIGRRSVIRASAGAGAAIVSGLAGCATQSSGNTGTAGQRTGTASRQRVPIEYVDVTGEREVGHFEPIIQQLEEEFDAVIDLTYTDVPYENLKSTLLTRVGGGNAPDIAAIDQIWLGSFITGGILLELDEVADDVDFDDYLDEFAAVVQRDGHVYGFPIGTDVRGMYWNKDTFEAAGLDPELPPETWSELLEMAALVHEPPDTYGSAYFVNAGRWSVNLFGAGGQFLNEDRTEPRFHEMPGVRAAEFVDRLYNKADITPPEPLYENGAQAAREFLGGQYAISVVEGSWLDFFWRNLGNDEQAMQEQFGFAATPRPDDGEAATMSGGFVWAAFQSTDHPRIVREFLRLVNERAFTEQLMVETRDIPTRESLFDVEAVWDHVLYADAVQDLLQRTQLRPVEHWPIVADSLDTALQRVAFGKQEPQASLETAAEEVRNALE